MRFLFTIAILGLGGLWFYNKVRQQKILLENTKIDIEGVGLSNVSINSADLNVTLSVTNNSDIGFLVVRQHFEVYIKDTLVSTINKLEQIRIPAKSTVNTDLTAKFNPVQVIGVALGGGGITGRIQGNISVVSGYLAINNIPINLEFGT